MKKVLDWLTTLLVFLLAVLVVIFRNDLTICAIIASIFGIVIGILNLINKNNYGTLVISISICLLISVLLYINNIFEYMDALTFMICSSVLLLTILSFITDIINTKNILKKYDTNVIGKVVDLIEDQNVSKEVYVPVYEYEVNGLIYNIDGYKYYDKNIPNIGDEIVLRIDSKEPTEVYFKKTFFEEFKFKIVAIVMMIMCIIILVSLF